MAPPPVWYCGWCGFGPLSVVTDVACCTCHRLRDQHCSVDNVVSYPTSNHHSGPDPGPKPQPEGPRLRSVSATDAESVRSRAAPSPADISVDTSPTNPASTKGSHPIIDTATANLGLPPNDLIPPTVRSSWEPDTASPNHPVTRKDTAVNLNKDNVSRIDSIDKQSWLNEYLSVNPEDPWNHEWVVYAARTPLPGEASYLLETGEPATTSRRRRYNRRRRAEVAFTRNNGGACEPCRRRHHACPHRLQELARTIGDGGTVSERTMGGGLTRHANDAVRSGVAAAIGSGTQLGGTIHSESSANVTPLIPTPRRERPQRRTGHGRMSVGPSEHLALEASQRPQALYSSSTLENEFGTIPGRPYVQEERHIPRAQPRRWSAPRGPGSNVMSENGGSSRQLNNAASWEPSRDFAASTPLEGTYSLGNVRRGTEELSYVSDGAGRRSFPPLPHNEQQSLALDQMFPTQPDIFETVSDQENTRPYDGFAWSEDDYANLSGTLARSSIVTDPPRSSSRNDLDLIPLAVVDESNSPFFRPSDIPSWPSQEASFGRGYFNEHHVGSSLTIRDGLLPQTVRDTESMSVPEDQQAVADRFDEILDWQIEDGSILAGGPPEPTIDAALPDDLLAFSDQRGDRHATQLPSAANVNSQPAGPYEWIDIDPAADLAWDNLYYGGVDRSIDPALGSYAAYVGEPFYTNSQEGGSWSNSDPIPTPPSDEAG